MNISNSAQQTALSSYHASEAPLAARIDLLKKANDQTIQQGTQLIQMLEDSAPPVSPDGRLDSYA